MSFDFCLLVKDVYLQPKGEGGVSQESWNSPPNYPAGLVTIGNCLQFLKKTCFVTMIQYIKKVDCNIDMCGKHIIIGPGVVCSGKQGGRSFSFSPTASPPFKSHQNHKVFQLGTQAVSDWIVYYDSLFVG